MQTYDFRLPPGPNTPDLAALAEKLGYNRVWCPEIPAFGHDVWVTLSRIAERTSRIGLGVAVLVPSYRHPVAQAGAIATIETLAPGRLAVGFGTGFTGRGGMGQPPLTLADMREHITQVRALLAGESVIIDGARAQMSPFTGWQPDYPIKVPLLLASQGPKGRKLAKEIADGMIAMGIAIPGFTPSLVSLNGIVLNDDEEISSSRAQAELAPLAAIAYHAAYMQNPQNVKALPNGEAWLRSVEQLPEETRHLSVNQGHNQEISNGHDELVDPSLAAKTTFTGTREQLQNRLTELRKAGATGFIFGTSGVDVEREMRAFAEVAELVKR